MDIKQSSRFVGIKRVAGFGEQYSADMGPVPPDGGPTKAQQLFAELGTTADIDAPGAARSVVGILGRAATAQLAGGRDFTGGSAIRAGLREKLRGAFRELRKDSRAIAQAHGIRNVLKDFGPGRRRTDTALASQVRALAKAAEPLRAQFVELEYPGDFIESLLADVEAFENTRDDQNAGLRDRAGAGMEIDTQLARGRLIIAQLDAIMRKKYRDRPTQLALWRLASRLEPATRARTKRAAPAPVAVLRAPLPALMAVAASGLPAFVPAPTGGVANSKGIEVPMRVTVSRARRKACPPAKSIPGAGEPASNGAARAAGEEQPIETAAAASSNGYRTGPYD